MCGRFTLLEFEPARMLMEVFGIEVSTPIEPRYNIAPAQPVAAVRISPAGAGRELVMLRWGLVPRWAKDPSVGNRFINARAETVAEKPTFREAFRRRRCLVPASGFYEWKKEGRRKQPYYIRRRDGRPFAFAGLWERWDGQDEAPVESCALITTEANELISTIHDRMPAILRPADHDLWLAPAMSDPERLLPVLRPWSAEDMEAFAVGFHVNDPKTDDRRCIIPVEFSG